MATQKKEDWMEREAKQLLETISKSDREMLLFEIGRYLSLNEQFSAQMQQRKHVTKRDLTAFKRGRVRTILDFLAARLEQLDSDETSESLENENEGPYA